MRHLWLLAAAILISTTSAASEAVDIGSRLELFVDDFLVESLSGDAARVLQRPVPQEVVLITDRPWEGNTCAYYTVLRDGDRYRLYYRGSHYDEAARTSAHREVTCYAESQDGVHWTRPELGLFEFDGSKQNNIVWDGIGAHCFTPFKDGNPDCAPEERYKAISAEHGPTSRGLYAFRSPDGIHWSLMQQGPVITEGAFDSQNLAFWDGARGRYVDYHRTFQEGLRDIMTATSDDFLQWTKPVLLEYTGAPREHLYTNAVLAYERAPHLLLGFPTRFLPEKEQVEPTLMSSRDGRTFHRWQEPLIPRDAPQDRDGNRSNYMAWGMVRLPGNDREYSMYATEAYYTGPSSRLRRFTFRADGFVAVRAERGGRLVTRPVTFEGSSLVVNFRTAERGAMRVELQDDSGQAIDGFALADCRPLQGDEIAQPVNWNADRSLTSLSGKPLRICFELSAADLFSFRFVPEP